jgi:alkylhydroperoxidase family enzyme
MRIKAADIERSPANARRIYRKSEDRYGRVPTPLTALGHCPDVLETLTALSGALTSSQLVEPKIKTLACLRAAQIAGCPF